MSLTGKNLLGGPARTDTRVTGWVNLFDGRLEGQILMPATAAQPSAWRWPPLAWM